MTIKPEKWKYFSPTKWEIVQPGKAYLFQYLIWKLPLKVLDIAARICNIADYSSQFT